MTDAEWQAIFDEAEELGISFILVAGGEPMLRRGVIEAAGKKQSILFPIFTNGTYLDENYLKLFGKCRNLIPVMSIEGSRELTDERRGKGCKAVIFVEYVPVTEESKDLAPPDTEREYLRSRLAELREAHPEMVYISFPGDEKRSGGCVAAGRGFFHINSHGGAEPYPFSPFSDINVEDSSLKDAMNSSLFRKLREEGYLLEDHDGGCILYDKRKLIEQLINV